MNFAFLFPLAWLGAAAVVVPLWLHLERRREANLVEFSALRFLDDQPMARSRPLWPRDLPLLLLRLLGLLLLVAAFSWPYLIRDDETPQLVSESTVFILDNTLSHQAGGQFDQAREELIRQLRGGGQADQAAVVQLRATPHVLVPFGTDRDEAIQLVQEISPAHQRGSYRAAFLMAGQLLRQSLGSRRRIVFLGDHQENQWEESSAGAPFLENVELVLTAPRQRVLPNLALAEPRVRRFFLGDQGMVECLVQLSRKGTARSARIEARSGDLLIAREDVTIPESESTMTLAFQWPADPAEWLEGDILVAGTPDRLEADNRVYFALPPVEPGKLDLVAQSRFLRTALAPDVMEGRWETRTIEQEDLAKVSGDGDVLCIESSRLDHPQAWQLLLAYLNQDKGVLLVLDRVSPRVVERLRRLELEVGESVTAPSAGSRLRYVFQSHPLFLPFRSPDFGDLLEIQVRRYHRLESFGGQPLMFSHAGDPLLVQTGLRGNLFVLNFGLDRESTNWVIQPTFVPFLDRCLTQARNLPLQQSEYAPGEMCVWTVVDEQSAEEIVLRREGEVVERVRVEGRVARFAIPDQPGLYHLSYDDQPVPEAILQVNPPPEESDLVFTDPEPLAERWVFRDPAAPSGADGEIGTTAAAGLPSPAQTGTMDRTAILRQQFWWWLLLAAAVALLIETSWLSLRRESR